MNPSTLISKVHQAFARVFLGSNLFDSLFRHHAAKVKQNHELNVKNGEQTQSRKGAGQVQFDVLELGAMECWHIGPSYTWCRASRMRN
jgi:hypothetical protein